MKGKDSVTKREGERRRGGEGRLAECGGKERGTSI